MRARWLELTRILLPAMAATENWPIRLDHCFMRVFLDHAVGAPWHTVVPRPAIHNIAHETLARAIALAERTLREPAILPGLNAASLARRRA